MRPEELYGAVLRVVVDGRGRELRTGLLTADGRLLPADETGTLYVDAQGSFTGKMVHERDGQPAEPRPSSFKEARELALAEPGDEERLLVSAVYPVAPPPDLAPGLYRTTFNYTAAVEANGALLRVAPPGSPSFLLVGTFTDFLPVGQTVARDLFDAAAEEDAEDDDTGFSFGDF